MKTLIHIWLLVALFSVTLPTAVQGTPTPQRGALRASSEALAPVSDSVRLARGLELFGQDRFEEAREELYVSARSEDGYIRAESFLYLNALETELGNHPAARAHLERYHAETVRLMRQADEARRQMDLRMARLARRENLLVGGLVLLGLVAIGVWVWLTRRRANATQTRVVSQLASPAQGGGWRAMDHSEGGGGLTGRFATREPDLSAWEPALSEASRFAATDIYAEIAELSSQKPDRHARVLSLARQEVLDSELEAAMPEFRRRLREDFPALTAGDVKLCCLSLVPLSSLGRALCYGSTETNIIKQRKHQIKKKLPSAVFEFVFAVRG